MFDLKLLSQGGFLAVNKRLIREIGLNEAVILADLCSSQAYWEARGELKDGFFFKSIKDVQTDTSLGDKAQRRAMANLCKKGLLEQKNMGSPCRRFFRVNQEALEPILGSVSAESRNQFLQNDETSFCKTTELVSAESACNKNTLIRIQKKNSLYLQDSPADSSGSRLTREQIDLIKDTWNSRECIKTSISDVPQASKRYNNLMSCIQSFGFDAVLGAVKDLDSNEWFDTWKPPFDWFCDPDNMLKVIEGNYKTVYEKKENPYEGWEII